MVKISIIVPTYNGEQYILKCINSLLDQTLKEIEIIVIDDGSTDNTKNLVLQIKDPIVTGEIGISCPQGCPKSQKMFFFDMETEILF